MFSSYTAACFARKYLLMDRHGVNLEGTLTWAFEFEEQPLFAGFRALATGGIDLPVLNVFRMLSQMQGQRVATHSTAEVTLDSILKEGVRGATPDVAALAAQEGDTTAILIWHYHDDDLPGPPANVTLKLSGLRPQSKRLNLTHYRIDAIHSNAFTTWKRLGAPVTPTRKQYRQIERAGKLARLAEAPKSVSVTAGEATLRFSLPCQAVSLRGVRGNRIFPKFLAGYPDQIANRKQGRPFSLPIFLSTCSPIPYNSFALRKTCYDLKTTL